MTVFNKKAYKGLPVKILVCKPKYYYQDIVEIFNESQTKGIGLVRFEGIDYEVGNYWVKTKDKLLWNRKMSYGAKKCLALWGKKYLVVVDGEIEKLDGCLENRDDGEATKLQLYVKKDDFILCEGECLKDGYSWGGEVEILEHEVCSYWAMNYCEANDKISYSKGDNGKIWCSLNPNGMLVSKSPVDFRFISDMPFFGYEINCTAKIRLNDLNGYRKLFVFNDGAWLGCNSGKLTFYNKITADSKLVAEVDYWISLSEVYQNGAYVLRISYIEDNGYEENDIPDKSLWVNKEISLEDSYFRNVEFLSLGRDDSNNYSWQGNFELDSVEIKFVSNGISETKWKAIDKI